MNCNFILFLSLTKYFIKERLFYDVIHLYDLNFLDFVRIFAAWIYIFHLYFFNENMMLDLLLFFSKLRTVLTP